MTLRGYLALLTVLICFAAIPFEGRAEGARKGLNGSTVTVTSDKLAVDNRLGTVLFTGNVAAEQDFLLCSDELYLRYNDKREVESITATGSVRIFRDNKESFSRKAVYDRKARTIVITGDAVFKQCADTVRGEKIVVYLDEDKALVDSKGSGRVKAVIMPNKKCSGRPEHPGEGASGKTRCKRARQGL